MPLRTVELHVLLALTSEPLHGYALVRRIEEDSDGRLCLLPGNLYTVIRRLEAEGLLHESRRRPARSDDQRRRYYQLTSEGRRVLSREAQHLEILAERIRNGLEPALENTKR
jgi:DNA-binding PadR family transcriptional regulator